MSERKILERLLEEKVVDIYEQDGCWWIDGNMSGSLTRAELLQLADEIRQLAGEDVDHA